MTKKDTGNENRGTEGVGSESDPPQKKKLDFVSQNGDFQCILGVIFLTVQLHIFQVKSSV